MAVSYTFLFSIFYLAGGVFLFLLGLTILRSGNGSAPTRATALILFFTGVGPILSASSIILQSAVQQDAVVLGSMMENFEYLWEFYFPSLLLFAVVYPRESRILPKFVFLSLLVFAPYIFHLITIMKGDAIAGSLLGLARQLPFEREVSLAGKTFSFGGVGRFSSTIFSTLIGLHKQLFLLVNIVYAALTLWLLSRSTRVQLNPRIVRQLRTVTAGVSVSVVAYTLAKFVGSVGLPMGNALAASGGSDNASLVLINFALVAGGGSVAYSVVRQQFLGIKYVVRKSILYGGVALLFAIVYLVVVKPVSDFFGQYSMVSKEAFETGFIILSIIAFQPTFFRFEEVLERLLLKGKDDLQVKFKSLGSEISNLTSEIELEDRLRDGFGVILDASTVELHLGQTDERYKKLVPILEEIGGPIMREEFLRLGESGRLGGDDPVRKRLRWRPGSEKSKPGLAAATRLAGDDEVLVPILRDGRCVGFVSVGEKTYGLRYSSEELALLSVLSNQIVVELDNIRLLRENVGKKLLEEELQIARRIQSQLLPSGPPPLSGYELHAQTIPSRQVGGDYYDFNMLDEQTISIVVADVSGKGIPASLLMATLHAAVNSNEDARGKPATMMQRMNALLYRSTSDEEFATVFYGVVDLASGTMRYANAGHEFPYMTVNGATHQLGESGMLLGCVPGFQYEERSCELPRGGALILYTDGVTDAEAVGGENFGEERLRTLLTRSGADSSEALCGAILGEVQRFSKGGDYHDDLTLVVLKRD